MTAALLPIGLTVADLLLGVSKLHNRVIGRVFHELGLVEQWCSGFQHMNAACRDAGLEAPVLEETGIRFLVTLCTAQVQSTRLDETCRAIVAPVCALMYSAQSSIVANLRARLAN